MPKLVQTVIDANGSIANVTNAEALIETPETSVGIAPTKIISLLPKMSRKNYPAVILSV